MEEQQLKRRSGMILVSTDEENGHWKTTISGSPLDGFVKLSATSDEATRANLAAMEAVKPELLLVGGGPNDRGLYPGQVLDGGKPCWLESPTGSPLTRTAYSGWRIRPAEDGFTVYEVVEG